MNLDSKYSKLQVYNKNMKQIPASFPSSSVPQLPEEEDDDSLLADFLSDVSKDEVRVLTGQTFSEN